MKRLFALWLLMPILLAPSTIISTEKDLQDAETTLQYDLTKTIIDEITYHQNLPQRPIGLTGAQIYADKELTKPITILQEDTVLSIKNLIINDALLPIFELTDGYYMLASQRDVADDIAWSYSPYEAELWLRKDFKLYKEPYYLGETPQPTRLSSYSKVAVSELVTNRHGTYFYISGHGWVKDSDFSLEDNRMEKVSQLLESRYNKKHLGISVLQLETGQATGIHENDPMYSASVTKLPLLYYVQHQLDSGKIHLSDRLTYIPEVHEFEGAYDPSGSGSMTKKADGKDYTVEYLLKAVAQESDNVATNILGYYVAQQYGKDYHDIIGEIVPWDMVTREVSPATASKLMAAIYQQNGVIISYLSSTRFYNQRIAKAIDTKIAHKIGDAYDFRHDVAIVYGESPFVLSVFTEKMTYDDISTIAKEIYTILK